MHIEVERAMTAEQRDACYKIRHDVFMSETGYIQNNNAFGREKDVFDELKNTYHFIAYYDGVPAGTVRLILPSENVARRKNSYFGLPIEDLFDISCYQANSLRIAEISRSSVKQKYRSTKTIFYLWVELINFAISRGVTDLISSVNPQTDKLCDAYMIYSLIKTKKLVNKDIAVKAKRPGIGKIGGFRFPLTEGSCCSCNSTSDKNKPPKGNMELPQTLKLFNWIGGKFTGEPVYCEKIDMCAMPMNLRLKDIEKTSFNRFFKRREALKEVANR